MINYTEIEEYIYKEYPIVHGDAIKKAFKMLLIGYHEASETEFEEEVGKFLHNYYSSAKSRLWQSKQLSLVEKVRYLLLGKYPALYEFAVNIWNRMYDIIHFHIL